MRFVGKSENGKKRSSDGSESRLLAKIKMAFTERSRLSGIETVVRDVPANSHWIAIEGTGELLRTR